MVVDTSVFIAILLEETDSFKLIRAIASSNSRMFSAATYLETSIVLLAKLGEDSLRVLDLLIAKLRLIQVPFSERQSLIAVKSYVKFGKGRHPAGLNFGDCFSYALAKELKEPLLFKGEVFLKTDIEIVSY